MWGATVPYYALDHQRTVLFKNVIVWELVVSAFVFQKELS
jgi:hypothetical protein